MELAPRNSLFSRLFSWMCGCRPSTPSLVTHEFAITQTELLTQTIYGGIESLREPIESIQEHMETQGQSLRSLRKATLLFDEARNELAAAHATLRDVRTSGTALEIAQHFRTWFVGARLRILWDELLEAWHANNASLTEDAETLVAAVLEFNRHFDHVNALLEPDGLRITSSVFSEFDPTRHEVVEMLDLVPEMAVDVRRELANAGLVRAEAETIIVSEIRAGIEHRILDAWKIRNFAQVTAFNCPATGTDALSIGDEE